MSAAAPTDFAPGRRAVLKLAGALAIGFRLHGSDAAQTAPGSAGSAAFEPNAWLRIEADGSVEVIISKTEMGQGTETGLAMIVADELDADWSRVRVRTMQPDGKRFMITGGSYSISASWDPARKAAAAAREMLLAAGAQALGVAASACRTEAGVVVDANSGRRIEYGALIDAAARRRVPAEPAVKSAQAYRLIGRPLPAKNLDAVVRARAVYGIDVRIPGMLYAVIERAPVINARLAQVDDAAARAVPGVVAAIKLRGNVFPTSMHVRDGVAVVARSTWAALQGRQRLKTQWQQSFGDSKASNGALASTAELGRDFDRALAGNASTRAPDAIHPAVTVVRIGTPEAMATAFERAERTLELRYDVPMQNHAPMEPCNAVAHWRPDRVELWAGTHFQSRLMRRVRELTGLPPERIVIHTPLLGGSFGRKLEADYALEAVMLSRELERPVQVLWTREDDLREGMQSPPTRHHVRVALGAQGRLLGIDHAFAAVSVRQQTEPQNVKPSGLDHTVGFDALKFPYAVEQLHVSHRLVEQAVRVLWWRRGYTPNHCFVNESMLDECAHAAGIDPLDYRLRLLGPPRVIEYDNEGDPERLDTGRLAKVLRLACEKAGWGRTMPAGAGLGLASTFTDTHVAQVVEVDSRGGAMRVVRVVCAVDCGRVINPQLVKAQVEGSVAYALTAALKGAITVERGRVQQSNFHDYPLLRFSEMPQVDVILVDGEAAPTGIGEQASHPTAAALANALFAATGERWRGLPFGLSEKR